MKKTSTDPVMPALQNLHEHPDVIVERLLSTILASGKWLNKLASLKSLHNVCSEKHRRGDLDFSVNSIDEASARYAGPRPATPSTAEYRTVISAWANYTGGQTKGAVYVQSERLDLVAVEYVEIYYAQHAMLPAVDIFLKDLQEGRYSQDLVHLSESSLRKRHSRAIAGWSQKLLSRIPEAIQNACEVLFESEQAIPSADQVIAALPELADNADHRELEEYIELWRECRFALARFNFSPSKDRTDFLWLTLHPALKKWRFAVVHILAKSGKKRKNDRPPKGPVVGLHLFFEYFLLRRGLPLEPKEFLSKGQDLPCFRQTCTAELSARWADILITAVYRMIEHMLEFGDGFFSLSEHGHRVRSPIFFNPVSSLIPVARLKRRVPHGAMVDPELKFITEHNQKLDQWRTYAVSWLGSLKADLNSGITAVRQFIFDYVTAHRLPTDPSTLLSRRWQQDNELPSYFDSVLAKLSQADIAYAKASEFIDYVLNTFYSAEDDFGVSVVSGDYRNFLIDRKSDIRRGQQLSRSNKDVLPSRFIRYLNDLVCPVGSKNFGELTWAHNAQPKADWFEVDRSLIDTHDPDCVWRTREVMIRVEGEAKTIKKLVFELWSPVRTVALIVKLELPLRMYQVRFLDSGEADTWRYEGSLLDSAPGGEPHYRAGSFVKNSSESVNDIGKVECHRGVFRRTIDNDIGRIFTALYINTNKTADRLKEQWDRGYVVKWEHAKVLYWLERLRNWQEKYNPISEATRCADLPQNVTGRKTKFQLQQMGSMCFLFRDPTLGKQKAGWPMAEGSMEKLWVKALESLGDICAEKGHKAVDGSRLRFVPDGNTVGSVKTYFPLHSLRVSLITHLATEGKVAMHILSECIAGHARILMTLYYNKAGVVYVTEQMEAGSKRIKDETTEQENFLRWIKEATLQQLEVSSASVDSSVLNTFIQGTITGGASLLRTNLGLCGKGGMGCVDGGINIDDETGNVSYGPVPGYPQQKNCVRCRWFLTGPAFLPSLVHHWNFLHLNLGDSGTRYLETEQEIAQLESSMYECEKLNVEFEHSTRLENLRHQLSALYEGNESIAGDSLATMKLIVRCKHIVDTAKQHETGVVLVAVGGIQEVSINVSECNELEQVLTVALGSTVYADEDASKALLKAGNAFDRMLAMNGKDPIFFKLENHELSSVVSHMTRLLQSYAGSIKQAVPFIEGMSQLSSIGIYGTSSEILQHAAAGLPLIISAIKTKQALLL